MQRGHLSSAAPVPSPGSVACSARIFRHHGFCFNRDTTGAPNAGAVRDLWFIRVGDTGRVAERRPRLLESGASFPGLSAFAVSRRRRMRGAAGRCAV